MYALGRSLLQILSVPSMVLLMTTTALAADRGIDPEGDALRPGLDILVVTTSVTDTDLSVEVELAGDWDIGSSTMFLEFGTIRPDYCDGYLADYAVMFDSTGIAKLSSQEDQYVWERADIIASRVDGPRVWFQIPLEGLGDPETLYFMVIAEDPSSALEAADIFPDKPGPEITSCRAIPLASDLGDTALSRGPGIATSVGLSLVLAATGFALRALRREATTFSKVKRPLERCLRRFSVHDVQRLISMAYRQPFRGGRRR